MVREWKSTWTLRLIARILVACVPLLILGGCGIVSSITGEGVTNGYSGPTRPDSEIAIIKGRGTGLGGADYNTAVVKFAAVDEYRTGTELTGYYTTVKALPGRHEITVFCGLPHLYAYPTVAADLKAGHTYQADCVSSGDYRFAQATISEGSR